MQDFIFVEYLHANILKMNIWEVYNTSKNGYCFLDEDVDEFYNVFIYNIFDGRKLLKDWVPVNVTLESKDIQGKILKPTCIPYFGRGYFTVQNNFLDVLDKLCGTRYEKLKLNSDDGDFTLINIVNVIDCLDLENTEYKVYKGNKNKIQKIDRFEFVKSKVDKEVIFKIKNYERGHIFCTDIFKKCMEEWNVGGLIYEKVWSD